MPPKHATNPKTYKSIKDLSEAQTPPKATITNSASGLDPEAEDRFELELCWCIQQLETSLASGKLQRKQAENIDKHLRSLKSNSASLIRKRQIMKNTLGDYRQKMIEDEQKLSKTVLAVKFASSASANKKSTFIRKAARHNARENSSERTDDDDHRTDGEKVQDKLSSTKAIIDSNRTQVPFQFNFKIN